MKFWRDFSVNQVITRGVLACLKGYKSFISPLLGERCRFYPSCADYAKVCIERHGVLSGVVLALGRVVRCHPWSKGGEDLPPNMIRSPFFCHLLASKPNACKSKRL